MASEQFSLCWDNFLKNMSSGMNSLFENEDLVDVTLAVQGKCLKAHKMVLSVCSPYFKELFKSNPCQHPIVFMKDVSYEALSDLLQFMYQGEVQVSQENLTTFIKTAEALQIKGLTGDGNGSTENEVTEVAPEKHSVHVEEYKPSPRPKKQQPPPAPMSSPSVKRQRLSMSSNDSQPLPPSLPPQPVTKTEPIATPQPVNIPSEPAAVHFKMEPYDSTQNLIDESGDDNFGEDALDETVGDDTEDYSMMEGGTGEEEPQAGTSADGAGEGQGNNVEENRLALLLATDLDSHIKIEMEWDEDEEEKGYSSGDSIGYPGYQFEGNADSDSDEQDESKHKSAKKRKAKPEFWKKNLAKRLRNEGKEYVNNNNKLVRERRVGAPCTEKCKLKCNTKIIDEDRQLIFNEYYNLPDLQSKRNFVAFHMTAIIPAYQYKRGRRRNNNAFYFTGKDGTRIRVCKRFFLSTLDLSDRFTRTVTEKLTSNIGSTVIEDLRGKHGKQKRLDNNLKENVKNFIKSIPKMESHCCRDGTKKYYIDGSKTIAEIHRDYVKNCEENKETSVNYVMFNKIFNGENIAFYQPEKDQCEECGACSSITEDQIQLEHKYDDHLKEELSRTEKECDKREEEKNDSTIGEGYDLQAAMPCPSRDVLNV